MGGPPIITNPLESHTPKDRSWAPLYESNTFTVEVLIVPSPLMTIIVRGIARTYVYGVVPFRGIPQHGNIT